MAADMERRGTRALLAVARAWARVRGGRGLAALCLLAAGLVGPQTAEGYISLDNDRILLMNNDSRFGAVVTFQGYNDTDPANKTYWVHDTTSAGFSAALLRGVNHTLFRKDGTRLWDLVDCRAGSATVISSVRNYIPWTITAKSIIDGTGSIPADATGVKGVGSVIFRNSEAARLYSPSYEEGIGTIYFDAVNAFVNATDGAIALEIATNVTAAAAAGGIRFSDAVADTSGYDVFQWEPCPVDVFTCANRTDVTLQEAGATNVVLASTASGDKLFYRLRAHLNHYGPIRFRIRRLNETGGSKDTAGLILIDNVIASYPPMTCRLRRHGGELDLSLTGADVLGVPGDFTADFPAQGQTGVRARAWFDVVTNAAVARPQFTLKNPRLVWRWRYLNQAVTEWREQPMAPASVTYAEGGDSNLLAAADLPLQDGVGDLEYFFVADQTAPYYIFRDYALSSVYYGDGWSEAVTTITNRAAYTAEDGLPSCGTDWFVRIREGASDYEWVKFCATVTTNGTADVKDVSMRMALVTNHTWRCHYYVPTNAVGETLRFHFQGKQVLPGGDGFSYVARTNTWYTDLSDGLPYLPYTSVAGTDYGNEASWRLDSVAGAGTHLLVEFNDELLSFSVSHATYQNFNMWTDAMDGFRGNANFNEASPTNGAAASGVSDAKTTYDAVMGDWPVSPYYDALWREPFEGVDVEDAAYPLDVHQSVTSTPNGWNAENGAFTAGTRTGLYEDDYGQTWKSLAWRMDGGGKGTVSLVQKPVTGVGQVSFTARVAQTPAFESFATYLDGTACRNYAVSAQLTMSRLYDARKNPLDISPCQPSVSLVGYARGSKGCYELRFTRSGESALTMAFYKWTQASGEMTATLLASNELTQANLLVPAASSTGAVNNNWTAALFSLYTTGDGKVKLDGWLSSEQNASRVNQDVANLKANHLAYTDDAPGALTRGTYGVGSCDCQAAFGQIWYHTFTGDLYNEAAAFNGVNMSGQSQDDYFDDDWEMMYDRWRRLGRTPGTTSWESTTWTDTGLAAVVPTNQTVQLYVAEATGASQKNWVPVAGCVTNVSSFATNLVVFAPHTTADAYVQLRTGSGEASVTVADIEVKSWAAQDLGSSGSRGTDWYYTAGTIETAVEVEGGDLEVLPAGTNGYLYVFTTPGKTITLTPQMETTIDRVFLVGGGGGGGSVMGGGGGGGGVIDRSFGDAPISLALGRAATLAVGAGGANPYGGQPAGGNGGNSWFRYTPEGGSSTTLTANGGAGGAGWGANAGRNGGSGGGGANAGNHPPSAGTDGQGHKGGAATNGLGGGGGGAGAEGGNAQAPADNAVAGAGGDGVASDITGEIVYYAGGGGGGAGWGTYTDARRRMGGAGGAGGGGRGSNAKEGGKNSVQTAEDGEDGLGGGGGGGTWWDSNGLVGNRGGRGGRGVVMLRVRSAPVVCTLQPARGAWLDEERGQAYPMGLRSPFLEDGLSLLSFSYANANSNCVLWLQVCTNCPSASMADGYTRLAADDTRGEWTTKAVWLFPGAAQGVSLPEGGAQGADAVRTNLVSAADLAAGTCTFYQSLRAPAHGLMRLVVAPEVMAHALASQGPDADVDYGKITITKIYCYDEPALDLRSWWGWNLHTEGWNTADKSYAYLTDSPNGLSGMLNFSALPDDNASAWANGIGLGEANVDEYRKDNPFIQCPPLTNGIGAVSFRARTFTNDQSTASWVTLFGSESPDAYQVDDPDMWTNLAEFKITNGTYRTFSWRTTQDSTKIQAVRLEVKGARWGRDVARTYDGWEQPNERPIQRVCLDEISVSEPIVPRLVFRDVRPFRSAQLRETALVAVSNVTSMGEQPITGESWGLQARVEPQQMSEELDVDSLRVFAAVYTGVSPWGYAQWSNAVTAVELPRMGTNLVFRSHMSRPETIFAPVESAATVQFMVWTTYSDSQGVEHVHWLDGSEWAPPAWYQGIDDLNKTYGAGLADRFSAYTIIDTISPRRAWVNEVNYCSSASGSEAEDKQNQFVEFAVPQGADLTGWTFEVTSNEQYSNTVLAVFGYGDALTTVKSGERQGVDYTNSYTFLALRSPGTTEAAVRAACDGVWRSVKSTPGHIGDNGSLNPGEPYGIALVRPSGIVEHQVVVEGRNLWADTGYDFLEYLYSGTNMTAQLQARQPSASWFFAGREHDEGTLGVYRSHGEDATCWTNRMVSTPGQLNRMADGTPQDIDPDWFLRPNGTNVWIYAFVNSPHIEQVIAGVTNRTSQVIVIAKGERTNIVYNVDRWYAIGDCTTNGVQVAGARGKGVAPTHRFTLDLGRVEENMTVNVGDQANDKVVAAGLSADDPYYPAVMDWLHTSFGEADDSQIHQAEYWPLSGRPATPEKLGVKDMYWLDIDPTQPGWVLVAGMGGAGAGVPGADNPVCTPKPSVVPGSDPAEECTNIVVTVTMMITNTATGFVRAPTYLQGLEPGSSSANYATDPVNWTSCTFKVTGALQKPGYAETFLPLRWFVFGPDSFDENFQSKIEITDPFLPYPIGMNYGWTPFRNVYPIFYGWRLDGKGPSMRSTELLDKDSTYR